MPVFSHVLVLKAGSVLVAGRKGDTLNSSNLSAAFNARTKLSGNGKRYGLRIH